MSGAPEVGARVELGGVYNVRDLGGYLGADGRRVRHGMLFRASSLHRLTDEEAWRTFGAKDARLPTALTLTPWLANC